MVSSLSYLFVIIITELQRPEGPPCRVPDNDGSDRVTQHGGYTTNNKLPETYSLGLQCTSLILDIHAMIN